MTTKYILDNNNVVEINNNVCEITYENSQSTTGTLHNKPVEKQFSDIVKTYCATKESLANKKHMWLDSSFMRYKLDLFASGYLTLDVKNNKYEIIEFGSGIPVISYTYGSIVSPPPTNENIVVSSQTSSCHIM